MSCPPAPKRTTAELHRAIAAAHLALAEQLEAEAGDGRAAAPPPPLAKPPQRRGPRIARNVRPLTDDERERLARAGGILGE